MLFSYIHVITQTPERSQIIFLQSLTQKHNRKGSQILRYMHHRCIEMTDSHYLGTSGMGTFFPLAIHFRYVDGAQMGLKILKTRTGINFMEKAKIVSWKITSDTCNTKIGSTKIFKEKIKNNLSWRGNTTHRSLLKFSLKTSKSVGVFLVVFSVYLRLAS